MIRFKPIVAILGLAFGTLNQSASAADVTTLVTQELSDLPGKEALMLVVEYPPGAVSPPHRHNAHTFVYVLEGSVVMGVSGKPEVTLTPGQTFYENPGDVHSVARNASESEPAKFLVFFLKDKGAAVTVPAEATKSGG